MHLCTVQHVIFIVVTTVQHRIVSFYFSQDIVFTFHKIWLINPKSSFFLQDYHPYIFKCFFMLNTLWGVIERKGKDVCHFSILKNAKLFQCHLTLVQ